MIAKITDPNLSNCCRHVRCEWVQMNSTTVSDHFLEFYYMNKKMLRREFIIYILLLTVYTVSGQSTRISNRFQTRCGWYWNPTPSNYMLFDKDRRWLIGAQGNYQAKSTYGELEMPSFDPNEWVVTNANHYGYGCACLRLKVDYENDRVIEIKHSYAKPLSVCRQDKALKKWNDYFN